MQNHDLQELLDALISAQKAKSTATKNDLVANLMLQIENSWISPESTDFPIASDLYRFLCESDLKATCFQQNLQLIFSIPAKLSRLFWDADWNRGGIQDTPRWTRLCSDQWVYANLARQFILILNHPDPPQNQENTPKVNFVAMGLFARKLIQLNCGSLVMRECLAVLAESMDTKLFLSNWALTLNSLSELHQHTLFEQLVRLMPGEWVSWPALQSMRALIQYTFPDQLKNTTTKQWCTQRWVYSSLLLGPFQAMVMMSYLETSELKSLIDNLLSLFGSRSFVHGKPLEVQKTIQSALLFGLGCYKSVRTESCDREWQQKLVQAAPQYLDLAHDSHLRTISLVTLEESINMLLPLNRATPSTNDDESPRLNFELAITPETKWMRDLINPKTDLPSDWLNFALSLIKNYKITMKKEDVNPDSLRCSPTEDSDDEGEAEPVHKSAMDSDRNSPRAPRFLRECLEYIKKGSAKEEPEKILIGLKHAEALIRNASDTEAKASNSNTTSIIIPVLGEMDLQEISVEFSGVLLNLKEDYEMEGFMRFRSHALVALLVGDFERTGPFLIHETFNSSRLNLKERLEVMDLLVRASKELAGNPHALYTVSVASEIKKMSHPLKQRIDESTSKSENLKEVRTRYFHPISWMKRQQELSKSQTFKNRLNSALVTWFPACLMAIYNTNLDWFHQELRIPTKTLDQQMEFLQVSESATPISLSAQLLITKLLNTMSILVLENGVYDPTFSARMDELGKMFAFVWERRQLCTSDQIPFMDTVGFQQAVLTCLFIGFTLEAQFSENTKSTGTAALPFHWSDLVKSANCGALIQWILTHKFNASLTVSHNQVMVFILRRIEMTSLAR